MAEQKYDSVDDFLRELYDQRGSDIKDDLKKMDEWTDKENQTHMYNNLFGPGMDQLYTEITEELAKALGDSDKIDDDHDKQKTVKKVVGKALKNYFNNIHKGALDGLEEELDDDELYDILSHHFDTEHLGYKDDSLRGIRGLVGALNAGNVNYGEFKQAFDGNKSIYKSRSVSNRKQYIQSGEENRFAV